MNKLKLNSIIYDLIFNKTFREKFINDSNLLNEIINVEDIKTIDKNKLKVFSSKICLDIIEGQYNNGLLHTFPKTFNYLQTNLNISKNDIVYKFMESEEFLNYRSIPNEELSITFEESFYLFLKSASYYNDGNIKYYSLHELSSILSKVLNINKFLNFKIKSLNFKEINKNHWTIINYPNEFKNLFTFKTLNNEINEPIKVLYASSKRGFISGVINEQIETYLNNFSNEDIHSDISMKKALENMGFL